MSTNGIFNRTKCTNVQREWMLHSMNPKSTDLDLHPYANTVFLITGLQDFILICHPNAFFFSKIIFSCVISPCDIQRPLQEHQCTWNFNWSLCCCWHIPQNVPLQLQNGLKSPEKHTLHAQRCVTTLKQCFLNAVINISFKKKSQTDTKYS